MENEVWIFLRRKVSLLLVLLFFTVHTDVVTYAVVTLHYTFKVYVIRISLALPQNGRTQRLEATNTT